MGHAILVDRDNTVLTEIPVRYIFNKLESTIHTDACKLI